MKLPSPFWAVLLAALGVVLALAVLFHPTPENIALAVIGIGSNLVSGALGAFAGHASAQSNSRVTTTNAPVSVDQGDPQ
jgi:putative copper export protein